VGGVRLGFACHPQKLNFTIDKWQAILADDATANKALILCTVFYLNGLILIFQLNENWQLVFALNIVRNITVPRRDDISLSGTVSKLCV